MAWAVGHGGPLPTAPQMDAVLHSERVQCGAKRIHALTQGIADLPDGAMIAARNQAFIIVARCSGRPAAIGRSTHRSMLMA